MADLFYILAVVTVLGALSLVLVPNPVYCALSLVGSFFAMAGIFILLNQEFVAAIEVLIYAGAIMVLFLFVIMLLNLRNEAPFVVRWSFRHVLGVVIVLGILSQLVAVFSAPAAKLGPLGDYPPERLAKEGAVQVVGDLLFTRYVLPFEVISVLLMVAVMGAVLLAKRRAGEDGPAESAGGDPGRAGGRP
ncbi:MAG: NADH-quinone oxidoreductase subunit J [SAR324 cluster bacterium]